MSFGWSASDIAECVRLLIKIRAALQDCGGSAAEYQSAVVFLKGVETTVQGLENILLSHPDLSFQSAFQEHAKNLITVLTHFRKKTEGYDTSLGANATTSEAKKTWKKIKLALFGHIEELKIAISYPQSVVNDLIGLQALDILVNLSEKPTLSPQQFEDSTEEISRKFPILVATIEDLRSHIAEDFITIQQTVESNAQKKFDQIQQNLSDGNILQKSISEQTQADAEAQDLWQKQFKIYIAEIRDEAQKHFEALQEVKQAQQTNHQHSMQTALQVFSWRNAFRPAASRPVIKVIRKTVITNSRPIQTAPAIRDISSRGGSSQGANSKGGNYRGAALRGGVSRGESSARGSSRGGDPRRINTRGDESSRGTSLGPINTRGGESSRGTSLGPIRSRGGLQKGGTSSRGGESHRQGSKGVVSRGGSSQGGGSRGGSSNGAASRGGSSGGGDSRGGSFKATSTRGSSSQGGGSCGGNSKGAASRGGSSRGGDSRGGSSKATSSRGGTSQGGGSRGGSSNGAASRGSSSRGGDSRGGSSKATSARGGSSQGGDPRGGGSNGGSSRRGNLRGGISGNNHIRQESLRGGSIRGKRRGG